VRPGSIAKAREDFVPSQRREGEVLAELSGDVARNLLAVVVVQAVPAGRECQRDKAHRRLPHAKLEAGPALLQVSQRHCGQIPCPIGRFTRMCDVDVPCAARVGDPVAFRPEEPIAVRPEIRSIHEMHTVGRRSVGTRADPRRHARIQPLEGPLPRRVAGRPPLRFLAYSRAGKKGRRTASGDADQKRAHQDNRTGVSKPMHCQSFVIPRASGCGMVAQTAVRDNCIACAQTQPPGRAQSAHVGRKKGMHGATRRRIIPL